MAYDRQRTDLPTVAVCIAPSALCFGPEPARRGGRSDCRSGGVAAALVGAQAWLRDAEGQQFALNRRPSTRLTSGVVFTGSVPAGQYVLCATPIEAPFRFPPRPIVVEPGNTQHTFRLIEGKARYLRLGSMLVPFDRPTERLAAVLGPQHPEDRVFAALLSALGRYGYEPVIDLTRQLATMESDLEHAAPSDPATELLVLEFTAKEGMAAPPVGELIRCTENVAAQAGLSRDGLRLGRLVESPYGPVVVDNEIVLGFTRTIGIEFAHRTVAAAGGRIVEDLSDPETGGLVYVVRFDDAEPEVALELAESWLDQGVLHWMQPNVVEP